MVILPDTPPPLAVAPAPTLVKPAGTDGPFQEIDIYSDYVEGGNSEAVPDPSDVDAVSLQTFAPFRAAAAAITTYPDTITVDKTAVPTQGCRTYEVTLQINGTPPPSNPADVVIVIDTSGSMSSIVDGHSVLYYAKQAAKNLAADLLASSGNRVALVSYDYDGGGNGSYSGDSRLDQNFTSSISTFNSAVNGLSAGGGTNTQAGLQRAWNTVNSYGNTGSRKFIVFLTDGVPTISIGRSYGPNEPTTHNHHTKAAMSEGNVAAGYASVFTVGLLGAVPSGSLTVAREVLQGGAAGYGIYTSGYYETMSAPDVSGIFAQIGQNINNSATNAVVTDVISEEFNLVAGSLPAGAVYDPATRTITWTPGTIVTHSQLVYRIQADPSIVGNANYDTNDIATLTYTDVNGLDGQSKTFPIPNVYVPLKLAVEVGPDRTILSGESTSIGNATTVVGGYTPYTCLWTNNKVPGWSSAILNPTVSPPEDTLYTLTVTDRYGCVKSDTLTVFVRGSITLHKDVNNIDTDREFDIWVYGPEGHYWTASIKEGETQKIWPLKPGTYTVTEVVPMNYQQVSITSSTVTLSVGNMHQDVYIVNRLSNTSWFTDEDKKINAFTVSVIPAQREMSGEISDVPLGATMPMDRITEARSLWHDSRQVYRYSG